MFKLLHAFHTYNNQGKKETVDAFLVGGNRETCWRAVWNELGTLTKGIENQVRATNTIEFIRKGELLRGCAVTYANFVCDLCALKSEPFRVRLTVDSDRL